MQHIHSTVSPGNGLQLPKALNFTLRLLLIRVVITELLTYRQRDNGKLRGRTDMKKPAWAGGLLYSAEDHPLKRVGGMRFLQPAYGRLRSFP